jgi:glycosyltransferase involved in cell wall biosynthesis
MNCLFIASDEAHPTGSGMQRRVYQIKHDLQEATGGTVHLFNARKELSHRLRGFERVLNRLDQERRRLWTNPLRLLGDSRVSVHELHRAACRELKVFATRHRPFDRVVIDYPGFSDAVAALGLRSNQVAYATHHLESMAQNQEALLGITRDAGHSAAAWRRARSAGAELAAELKVLGAASGVFPISAMETEFLRATGIDARWYPYQPRGETLAWCESIKRRRAQSRLTGTRYFLSAGSGNIHNRESLVMVLRQLAQHGLPRDTKVVITGIEPGQLHQVLPGLQGAMESFDVRGRIGQEQFDELLCGCEGHIVPAHFGFGAHTRLADAAACGVPVVTDATGMNGVSRGALVSVGQHAWREGLEACLRGDFSSAHCVPDLAVNPFA